MGPASWWTATPGQPPVLVQHSVGVARAARRAVVVALETGCSRDGAVFGGFKPPCHRPGLARQLVARCRPAASGRATGQARPCSSAVAAGGAASVLRLPALVSPTGSQTQKADNPGARPCEDGAARRVSLLRRSASRGRLHQRRGSSRLARQCMFELEQPVRAAAPRVRHAGT